MAIVIQYSHLRCQCCRKFASKSKGGDNIRVLNAALPDIKGEFSSIWCQGSELAGALYTINFSASTLQGGGGQNSLLDLGFAASRSSSIYGAADTVQPPAICLIPQIKY